MNRRKSGRRAPTEGVTVIEDNDIERIKATHRPRLRRAARLGCRCGSRTYPCSALVAALEAERRAGQPMLEQQVTELIRRQYGGSTSRGAGGWA